MARNERLGDFWYSLGVESDKGSFARASEAINGLVNTFKTAAAIIGVGFTIKATVQNASEVYLMANKLGEGVQDLRKWEASSTVLRANFRGVVDDAINLDDKMKRINRGQWDAGLGTSAAQFGLDFDTFRSMGDMERTQAVLERALGLVKEGKMAAQEAAGYVKDIMGGSTADLFLKMMTPNAAKLGLDTVAGMLAYADEHILNTEKETESLDMLDKQFQTVKTTATSLWTLVFGQMSEKWLVPGTTAINEWLATNKPAIENGIKEAFDTADKAVTKIFEFFEGETWAGIWSTMKDAWTVAVESAKWIWKHTIGYTPPPAVLDEKDALEMSYEFSRVYGLGPDAAARAAADLFKSPGSAQNIIDIFKQALPPKLVADIITEYNQLVKNAPTKRDYMRDMGDLKGSWAWLWQGIWSGHPAEVKDGIVKPGGGIVQVDPNDWVLAFKNLGDVLPAFGQRAGAGTNTANVTISQNFTLNGNPMPTQVRDMAYRGTTSAMGEAFSKAGMIVQLMPATR